MMRIEVLGCSGGIGGGVHTTSLLVDDDVLIDAGTGVTALGSHALAKIDHLFLTHSHLDHIASLPLMLDSAAALRVRPLVVHAQSATIDVLKRHIFNWEVWPDFGVIPDPAQPHLRFAPLVPGEELELDGRRIRAIAVEHAVPAVGYLLTAAAGSLAFTGDTTSMRGFWDVLNACDDLRYLVIETTFPDADIEVCRLAKHLCPSLLVDELAKLTRTPEVFITHLMPGREDEIMAEIGRRLPRSTPRMLRHGQVFQL